MSIIETTDFIALVERTAARYLPFGRFTHGFARGKLLHDPVFKALWQLQCLPQQGQIVDIGCGRGLLFALLTTAGQLQPHSKDLRLTGIELRRKDAQLAQAVLGVDADIQHADACTVTLPACQAVVLLDVLLYNAAAEQTMLLARIAEALTPNGVLIMREANAGAGWRYFATWLSERFCALARGHWQQQYTYRNEAAWTALLQQHGFTLHKYPMSEGTPFANVLFVAHKSA